MRGIPYNWFENYLHNRTQFVKIGSSQSNSEIITCVIHRDQLWVLYHSYFTLMTYRTAQKNYPFVYLLMIQIFFYKELNSVLKYCNINKLSINFTKTTYMVISSARLRSHIHIPNIAHKTQNKYLGIYIDQNLHWGPQIQHINKKLAKSVAIIHKLRYFVDLHKLKQLYYSFIYPYLSYATITWGSTCKTSLSRILTKQNKCVRSMFFAYSRDNATPYYNLLRILKFENV